MENIVAVELFRRKHYRDISTEIHYYIGKGDREVDFAISKGGRVEKLIKVTYDISDPLTKKREIDALLHAASETKCGDLTVITWDYAGVEEHEGRRIQFVPLWKWLIEY
jgi:predicted AAA+ superfamily ATPase